MFRNFVIAGLLALFCVSSAANARMYGYADMVPLKIFLPQFAEVLNHIPYSLEKNQTGTVVSICISENNRGFLLFYNENNSDVGNSHIMIISNDMKNVFFKKKAPRRNRILLDAGLECGNENCAIRANRAVWFDCLLRRNNDKLGGFR